MVIGRVRTDWEKSLFPRKFCKASANAAIASSITTHPEDPTLMMMTLNLQQYNDTLVKGRRP